MLRRWLSRAVVGLVAATVGAVAVPGVAQADWIYCPPAGGDCIIMVGSPGSGGGGGGGSTSGSFTCNQVNAVWGCYDPLYGWYNPTDGCYWLRMAPPPPASDPVWNGHSGGTIYMVWCRGYPTANGEVWRGSAPPGYGGSYDYMTPAMQAVNKLGLRGPSIGSAPSPASSGAAGKVGLPVWLWTGVSATTWATPTPTVSATAGGITVSAKATSVQIVWSMGDGKSVTCRNPGTAYRSSYGGQMSPTCGYLYTQPSRSKAGGVYKLTATTTWKVSWWVSGGGGGITGTLTVTRSSTTTLRINELQAVIS